MIFDEFLKSISKIENIPLPAEVSQFKMVPPYREQLLKRQMEARKKAKNAGVLALFYPNNFYQTKLVLILRKAYEGVHSAQVGFPGGKLETHDTSLQDAALRETFEEIGIPVNQMEIVKQLTPVYIPLSNFNVQPFLGITTEIPKFVKDDTEVETIIEVDLEHFLDDNMVVSKKVKTSYAIEVHVPAYKLNGYVVWGATAMMLSEIKDILKQLIY